MTADIRGLIERSSAGCSVLADLIRERGGRVIPAIENRQPEARLQIASIHFGGITGIGPGLLGASADWRRQALEEVSR